MLLPPDLRDWVAKDDLVRFVIDAVESCDLRLAKVNERGTGSFQYPPGMMLSLLIYCYANRMFSSRQIEAATFSHMSVRFVCAGQHPDHDTIAAFRRNNAALLESCFVAVLQLARDLKAFGQLGTVSVDGTKLGARASRKANRKLGELESELAGLQDEIRGLIATAAEADAQEAGALPSSLAAELQDRQARVAALQGAQARLKERQAQSSERRRQQAKGTSDPEDPSAPSCPPRGGGTAQERAAQKAGLCPAKRDAQQAINLTDSESRLMRDAHGVYLQGYNAQFVVEAGEESRSQLIVGVTLTNECNDRRMLGDALAQVPPGMRQEIKHALLDTGYDNSDLIADVEKEHQLTVLCPPQSAQAPPQGSHRLKHVEVRRRALAQAMRERLQEPAMAKLYRRRSASVEPVIGVLKNVLGFRRFRLFGLAKSKLELTLLAIAYNLRRLSQMALGARA